jgi:hypothetical protein
VIYDVKHLDDGHSQTLTDDFRQIQTTEPEEPHVIIPVRVAVDAPLHLVGGQRTLTPDHPLYDRPCHVCGERLGDTPITLVYVGTHPSDRKPAGYTAGSAVAVHVDCAGPGASTEGEIDLLADALVIFRSVHKDKHPQLNRPGCQYCRIFHELQPIPAMQRAENRLAAAITDAVIAITSRKKEQP